MKRLEHLLKEDTTSIIICERTVETDRNCFAKELHESGHINDLEWKLYNQWYDWLRNKLHLCPKGVIYLQSDPDICYKRIAYRARQEECIIPIDYLKSIHNKHELWIKNIEIPTLIINVNADFEHDHLQTLEIVRKIKSFIVNIHLLSTIEESNSISDYLISGNVN